jgi:hypothetical protein
MSYFSKNRFSLILVTVAIALIGFTALAFSFVLIEVCVPSNGVTNAGVPNVFTSGTTISSSAVNQNFTTLAGQMPAVDWQEISKVGIDVRTSIVNLASVGIDAPCAGYVVVRFDGAAFATPGDRLHLAASDATTYGATYGNVYFEGDGTMRPFSHTRVFSVSKGCSYFYALAHNAENTSGSGTAHIYGTLTATFYPNRR